ncbi:MAG: hypothetical protein ACYC27_15155 [Armatimonadota bacterium]
MRMTRDAYAREVWKVVEELHGGYEPIPCPHENCQEQLRVLISSVKTGIRLICPQHGLIFHE